MDVEPKGSLPTPPPSGKRSAAGIPALWIALGSISAVYWGYTAAQKASDNPWWWVNALLAVAWLALAVSQFHALRRLRKKRLEDENDRIDRL